MSARANKFLIWRVGTSVDWDCTAAQIAKELGLSKSYVQRVCKERGWKLKGGRDAQAAGGGQLLDVDRRIHLSSMAAPT